MKKLFLKKAALLLPLLAILGGCTTSEEDYIKVNMTTCSFRGLDASPVTIQVNAEPKQWKAEVSGTWIKIVEQTETTLVLNVDDNTDTEERTGEVTLTAGKAMQTIRVVQIAEHVLQSSYRTYDDYTMGAVVSPNGRYVGGFTAQWDSDVQAIVMQVNIVDLRNDKVHLLTPFSSSLYNLYDPCAITDNGDVFFHCEDGRIVMFNLSDDAVVLNDVPGAKKPWISQVGSDESGVWVGWAAGGKTVYTPVKWTNGEAKILPLPEKTFRENKDWLQGGMARGCSHDGKIVYGTTWEGLDSFLMWWDENDNVRWVSEDLHQVTRVQILDPNSQTYFDANLVNGVKGSSNSHNISPSGRWIAGMYCIEKLSENKIDIEITSCPAFYDTVNDKTYTFPEYHDACGMTVTDDVIVIIGLNAATGIMTGTCMIDIENGTDLGSTTSWIMNTLGISVPADSYVQYITPDKQVVFGYDLNGQGGEAMRMWTVAPKLK